MVGRGDLQPRCVCIGMNVVLRVRSANRVGDRCHRSVTLLRPGDVLVDCQQLCSI